METPYDALGQIIAAVGTPEFVSRTASTLCDFTGFDLAAIALHRGEGEASILFDNFNGVEPRCGIETYAKVTHTLNPMSQGNEIPQFVRARDYAAQEVVRPSDDNIEPDAEEELGYRTVGWPARQEEIGLHFSAWGGMIEIALLRERGDSEAPPALLNALDAIGQPIAAAFDRHAIIRSSRSEDRGGTPPGLGLTPREAEVCLLLLRALTNERIALRLAISPFTVKDHRKNIFRKLEISSLAELFLLAHRFPLWRDGLAEKFVENNTYSI